MSEMKTVFTTKKTEDIAKYLLGMYVEHETAAGTVGGYFVDVEAYLGPEDQAAHSYGMRQTPRLAAMYQQPGTIYLYTMHTHLILNIVTQPVGQPQGVMIRGLEPVDGLDRMIENRHGIVSAALTNGPGKLVQALGIERDLYGKSIFSSSLRLIPEKRRYPKEVLELPRIGIPNKGIWTEKPLRYAVAGNPYISLQKKSAIDATNGWRNE